MTPGELQAFGRELEKTAIPGMGAMLSFGRKFLLGRNRQEIGNLVNKKVGKSLSGLMRKRKPGQVSSRAQLRFQRMKTKSLMRNEYSRKARTGRALKGGALSVGIGGTLLAGGGLYGAMKQAPPMDINRRRYY